MKYSLTLVVLSILLVGAGCSSTPNAETDKTSQKDTNTPEIVVDVTTPTSTSDGSEVPSYSNLLLSATPNTNGSVLLEWSPSENENATVRLVRGPQMDPSYPGNYWFQQGKNTSATWINLPEGKNYFRACLFVDGACTEYSDNIEVNIEGGSVPTEFKTGYRVAEAFLANAGDQAKAASFLAPAKKAEVLSLISSLKGIDATNITSNHVTNNVVEATVKNASGEDMKIKLGVDVDKLGKWYVTSVEGLETTKEETTSLY